VSGARRLRLVAAFANTTGAIGMERLCRAKGLPGRLIPTPRAISASCGMAWMAEPEDREALEAAVQGEHTAVEGWYYVEM